MADSAERRYLEAQRELRSAGERLARLDQQPGTGDQPLNRHKRLTESDDPAAVARELLAQPWPDRVELDEIVTAYLRARALSREAWAELPPATQMRLAQPPED